MLQGWSSLSRFKAHSQTCAKRGPNPTGSTLRHCLTQPTKLLKTRATHRQHHSISAFWSQSTTQICLRLNASAMANDFYSQNTSRHWFLHCTKRLVWLFSAHFQFHHLRIEDEEVNQTASTPLTPQLVIVLPWWTVEKVNQLLEYMMQTR